MRFAIYIGIVAGLIWGGLWQLCSFFQFTRLTPSTLLEQTLGRMHWPTWVIDMSSIALFVGFSCIIAISLMRLPKSGNDIVRALLLAVFVTCLLVFSGGVAFATRMFTNLDWNTLITNFCLAAQWALFIDVSLRVQGAQEK